MRTARSQPALTVLAVIAVLAVVYVASSLVLPILVAGLFALLLNPAVRWLCARAVPRGVAASLILAIGLGGLAVAGNALYEPAMEAAANSPRMARQLHHRINSYSSSLSPADAVGEALETIDKIGAEPAKNATVTVVEDERSLGKRYGGLLMAAATAVTITMLVFLFLVYGEMLLRRIVSVAPTLSDKRTTVSVVRGVQSEVSRYVGTVTLINLGLGAVVALSMYLVGLEEPLLWGGAAALLNFAPYVGPFVGFSLLLAVGILQFDSPLLMVAPAAVYLLLNVIESQLVTPVVLGRSFSLNPVVILIWLLFCGWMWSVPGVLLAMPLLVSAKIVCLHSPSLQRWAQILER